MLKVSRSNVTVYRHWVHTGRVDNGTFWYGKDDQIKNLLSRTMGEVADLATFMVHNKLKITNAKAKSPYHRSFYWHWVVFKAHKVGTNASGIDD